MFNRLVDDIESNITVMSTERMQLLIETTIENLTSKLNILDEQVRTQPIATEGNTNFYQEAQKILITSIETAILNSPEFNHPFFLSKMIQAAKDVRMIEVIPLGTNNAEVRLNWDAVAGTIEDYAMGILAARNAIKAGSPRSMRGDGARRSSFWAEKYYGSAREGKSHTRKHYKGGKVVSEVDMTAKFTAAYWETMQMRVEESGRLAPFWEIIDKGTAQMAGKESDAGGVPYPINPPTYFVESASRSIKALYLAPPKTTVDSEQKELLKTIENIKYNIARLHNLAKLAGNKLEIIIQKIYDRMSTVQQAEADVTKVEAQAKFFIEHNRLKLDAEGKARFGGGVRPGLRSLEAELIGAYGTEE